MTKEKEIVAIKALKNAVDELKTLGAISERGLRQVDVADITLAQVLQRIGVAVRSLEGVMVQHGLLAVLHGVDESTDVSMDAEEDVLDASQQSYVTRIASEDLTVDATDLGEGSYGRVCSGTLLGLPVAVKMLKKSAKSDVIETTMNEVELMCRNRHPNVVAVLGVATLPVSPLVIVMERLEGSLRQLMENSQINLGMAEYAQIFHEAAMGLAWMHRLGDSTIHRDIKADNFLYRLQAGTYSVRVADLGLSVLDRDNQNIDGSGSVYHMSPEVVALHFRLPSLGEYRPASDVYSFGCMMCEMLHRTPMNQVAELASVRYQHELEDFLLRKDLRPTFSAALVQAYPELTELIGRCWKRRQADRPTMAQIVQELAALRFTSRFHCPTARAFWKAHFDGREAVPRSEFMRMLMLEIVPERVRDNATSGVLGRAVEPVRRRLARMQRPELATYVSSLDVLVREGNYVSCERFARLANLFGPIPRVGWDGFLREVHTAATSRAFFGDLSRTATETLLSQDPGDYCLRYASSGHGATFSYRRRKEKQSVVHIRIDRSPEDLYIIKDTAPFHSISEIMAYLISKTGVQSPISAFPYFIRSSYYT